MTDARTILPPNATPLERAIDQTAPQWAALADAVRSGTYHDSFLPWLAAEWGLSDLARHFADTRALIDAALPWLFERGTPAAVLRALSWIGFATARLDADGPWLHIDLGRTASTAELAEIAHVVRASIPAHVSFYRVYYAWDLRAIWLDGGTKLDSGVLDNESGAWVDITGDDPIKVSFGRRSAALLPRSLGQPLARCISTGRKPAQRPHAGALDVQRLDFPVLPTALGGGITVRPALAPQRTASAPPHARRVPTAASLCAAPLRRQPQAAIAITRVACAPRPQPLARTWDTVAAWDALPWHHTHILSRLTTETA
ncbi:phage tail protein [Ottowia sp.]|uniref:phage tail protein n=1 Tax=Ottowia sp. TaxID=1898956 RepID=UPI003A8BC2CA